MSVRLLETGDRRLLETGDLRLLEGAAPVPAVTSVTPSSGGIAGGTSVVLGGTDFTDAVSVVFGATDAASFTVDSDVQITAVSPAHAAGTVQIVVS